MLYLTKNVDTHSLYIFSKLQPRMSMCSFYIFATYGQDSFGLDWTVFMQERNLLLNLQVRTFSYWLWLKKVAYLHVQVIFQTCRFYSCLCFLPRRIPFFYYKVFRGTKIKNIYSCYWSDTAERHFEGEKENVLCGGNARSASVIKFLPLLSCTSEQVMFDLCWPWFFYALNESTDISQP